MRSAQSVSFDFVRWPWVSLLFSMIYVALVMFVHSSPAVEYLVNGHFSGLVIAFLLGTLFVVRDVIQHKHEQMGKPALKCWGGLDFSMMFVAAGALSICEQSKKKKIKLANFRARNFDCMKVTHHFAAQGGEYCAKCDEAHASRG